MRLYSPVLNASDVPRRCRASTPEMRRPGASCIMTVERGLQALNDVDRKRLGCVQRVLGRSNHQELEERQVLVALQDVRFERADA